HPENKKRKKGHVFLGRQRIKLAFYDFLRSQLCARTLNLRNAIWLDCVDMSKGDLSVFQHGVDLLGAYRITYQENMYDKMVWYNEGIRDIEKTLFLHIFFNHFKSKYYFILGAVTSNKNLIFRMENI
ncbi:hypothetical protein ACJX0J_039673, partial [Zea mays]